MQKTYFKKFNLKYLSMIIFLFLFIFTPLVLLPFNILHILTILSLIFLLTKYRKSFFEILISPELNIFFILHFFLFIYSLSLNAFVPGGFGTVYSIASTIIEVLPCAIFISIVFLSLKIDLNKFYDIILIIGIVQVGWVIFALIVPELRDWIITNSGSQKLKDTYDIFGEFRMYGLARGYTFSMPLFQGLCIIIASVLGTYKSSRYYLLIPFYVVSVALNARIALMSLFIAPFIIFFFRFKKHPIKQIFSVLFLFIATYYLVQIIRYQAENSSYFSFWNWLHSGIDEVISFKSGEAKGNLVALTDTMWFRPEGFGLLFGTGEIVFGRSYKPSDIGYVVNLYYGGVVFSILLYTSYFVLLMKYRSNNLIEKSVNLSIVAYLFIANFKGNVFYPNEVINGVLILIVFSITARKFQMKRSMEASARSGE